MKWQRVLNSFIFSPTNNVLERDSLENNISSNFKVSSNIYKFCNSTDFTLDDITNINFGISHNIISTSSTNKLINMDNLELKGYIHNLKITISISVEYKTPCGIKLFVFSSSIGDFISSPSPSTNVSLSPLLICLWIDNLNNYNATLIYKLYEIE